MTVPLNVLRVPIISLFDPASLIYINHHYKQGLKDSTEIGNQVNGRPLGQRNFETFSDILTDMMKLKFLTSSLVYLFPI
jgi:hypothetical protein